MPTHVYHPTRSPASWWDRLLVHPIDSAVALLAVMFGALAALSMVTGGFTPSKSLDSMPTIVVWLFALFLVTGGVLALLGLNWPGEDVSTGWALERFGWLLSFGGFTVYTISVCWHYPGSIFSWLVPGVIAIGCLLRFRSLVLIERSVRRAVAEVKDLPSV